MALYTLADLAPLRDGGDIITEVLTRFPELGIFPTTSWSGDTFKTDVLTSDPAASFHLTNEGVIDTKMVLKEKIFQLFNLSTQCKVSVAALGATKDPTMFFEKEASSRARGVARKLATQIWQGTSFDAKGFPGMIEQHEVAATHNHTATGSTAKTSVWFMELSSQEGPSILENENNPLKMNPEWGFGFKPVTLTDGNGYSYQGWNNWINGAFGLKIENKNTVVRIKDIGTGAGKTLTDKVMGEGLRLVNDLEMMPTHIFMNSRSMTQLVDSRQDTNTNLALDPLTRWLPSWNGIPIVVTPRILNTET